MPRKIKKYSEPEPIQDGGLDIYREVWTVISNGSTEINRVYLKKEDAEKACEARNKEVFDYSRNSNKRMTDEEFDKYYNDRYSYHARYTVRTLADAIDDIKSEVYDNASDPGEEY
jgi:hypothetical protein